MKRSISALLASWVLCLGACLADEGRCSPHQELNAAGLCVCVRGYVPDAKLVCHACADHEVSQGDVCVCAQGYSRGADMLCAEQSSSIGSSCSGDEDCEPSAPHCDLGASEPYCTTLDCSGPSDCAAGYACDTDASPALCRRGPSGLGDSCRSAADCAGKEASYCETNRANACLVPDCHSDGDCFIGWECCDLTSFGLPTLCVREAACPVP
jgi:hypothetical protein